MGRMRSIRLEELSSGVWSPNAATVLDPRCIKMLNPHPCPPLKVLKLMPRGGMV